MKTSLASSLLALMVFLLFLPASPVFAYLGQPIEIEQKVGARSTEQTGVTVKAKREKGGAVTFNVTRYIPKGQPVHSNTLLVIPIAPAVPIAPKTVVAPDTVVTTGPLPAPDVLAAPGQMMTMRTATLEVRSAKSLLCKTQVAAQRVAVTGKDIEIYQFSLSPECLDHSTFSLTESTFTLPDKAQPNNAFIGGGTNTRYIFNLAEIAEESFKIHTPW
jgi:hypothetical protein